MQDEAERVAACVRSERKARCMSVRQVGEAAEISFSTVARCERGEPIGPKAEARLLAWLEGRAVPQCKEALEARIERLEYQVANIIRSQSNG